MFSICKKIAIGSALMSVLYGCSQPLENGIYVVDSVKVDWAKTADNDSMQAFYDQITNSIKEVVLESSYIELYNDDLTYYVVSDAFSGKLNDKNSVELDIGTLVIKNNTASSLTINSQDFDSCRIWQCIVNIKLTKTAEDDPHFQKVESSINEYKTKKAEWVKEAKMKIMDGIATDYIGERVWLGNNLVIKLKPSQLIGLRENYEIGRTIKYGDLELNKDNDQIYNIEYSNQYNPSSNVTNIQTSATVSVVPSKLSNIDFAKIKQDLKEIYYEDDYGFVGQHEYGEFAFYHYYDDSLKSYVIGQILGNNMNDMIAHYVSLRSIDSDKHNQNIISVEDFALSLPELEDKYNVTLEGLFNKETIQKNYSDVLKRYLTIPDVFYNNRSMLEEGYVSVN